MTVQNITLPLFYKPIWSTERTWGVVPRYSSSPSWEEMEKLTSPEMCVLPTLMVWLESPSRAELCVDLKPPVLPYSVSLVSPHFCSGFIASWMCQDTWNHSNSCSESVPTCVWFCWLKQRYIPVTSVKSSHFLLSKAWESRVSISSWGLPWLPTNFAKVGQRNNWGHYP